MRTPKIFGPICSGAICDLELTVGTALSVPRIFGELRSMSYITLWVGTLLEKWQNATLVDYGHMVLAVVLLGWFVSRLNSR